MRKVNKGMFGVWQGNEKGNDHLFSFIVREPHVWYVWFVCSLRAQYNEYRHISTILLGFTEDVPKKEL